MGRLVQLARKAELDTATSHDRPHLADSLSGDSTNLWLCDRSSDPRQAELDDRLAFYHQFDCQSNIHTDSVRHEKSPLGIDRHRDRLGHDNLDDGRRLASPPLGRFGSIAVLRVGVARNRTTTIDHLDELGTVMINQVSTIPMSVLIVV